MDDQNPDPDQGTSATNIAAVPPIPTDTHRAPDVSRKIMVRLLDPRDSVHELTEMLHRAYKRHADRGMRAIAAFQDDMTTVKRIAGGECYVAALRDDERRIVGTIVFKDATHTKGTPWFERGDVASFSQLAVEPWLQGRGIGGLLIRTAERRAAETGAAEIALSTPEPATELVAMYAHKGYRIVEHMNWPGTNYRSAIMSKAVTAPAPEIVIESAGQSPNGHAAHTRGAGS
jgi:GNAT superfamily N-acetyltransferase